MAVSVLLSVIAAGLDALGQMAALAAADGDALLVAGMEAGLDWLVVAIQAASKHPDKSNDCFNSIFLTNSFCERSQISLTGDASVSSDGGWVILFTLDNKAQAHKAKKDNKANKA